MNAANDRSFLAWTGALVLLTLTVTACQPKAVRPAPPPPVKPVDTAGAVRYTVDGAASRLHILVYRAGTMARLGHNHVLSSKDVSGVVYLHDELARSRVELTLPVASLIVDDPQARAAEGEEFSANVPQDAREGAYKNLTRPDVLDVERFPAITMRSIAVSGTRTRPSLIMRVTIKDVSRDVVVLTNLQQEETGLVAEGELSIQQTDFGIAPFSVAMGALQVQDRVTIRFRIAAVRDKQS